MPPLVNDLKSKGLELQTIPGLVTKTARLLRELYEARKEIENHVAKRASLKEFSDESTVVKKEVSKLLSSVTKLREHRFVKDALTRQQESEMELLKEGEKTSDGNLASVKKVLAGVNVEKASLWWYRGNTNDKIEALKADVALALKAEAGLAQQHFSQVVQSVDAASLSNGSC